MLIDEDRNLRLMIEGVTDYAIYMLDPQGVVVRWNKGAERIKGYLPGEIIGQHFSKFYLPEDIADGRPEQALRIAAETGRFEAEAKRVRKDGTVFWASVVIDAIRSENGSLIGFSKVTRDITEKMAMQEELHRTREQLFQSQKMEAVGQLTGGIAHDFNNLLTGVIGSLDLMQKRLRQGRIADAERMASLAISSSNRAASVTHRLLAFSRRQTLNPKPVDIRSMIAGMTEMISRNIGENISLTIDTPDSVGNALCDQNQLESGLLNLVLNSRDAMPDGGRMIISVRDEIVGQSLAAIHDIVAGRYVKICVTDNGCGMSKETIEKAFDPFFTTKPIGQGTGLGLSMIYGFAKQTGGFASIDSQVGEGSTVCIHIPFVDRAPDVIPEVMMHTINGVSNSTIMVVEDEGIVRELVVDSLRERGFMVLEAHDGAAAMLVIESNTQIDVLLSDIGLPGINGRELADRAMKVRPDLRVLLMTGYADQAISACEGQRPIDVITKPFQIDDLSHRIATVLSQ